MERLLVCLLCLSGLGPAIARAQDEAAVAPLTARAIKEFAQGDKAAACADGQAALAQNPADEKALGIVKMTCGEKAIDKMDFKKKAEKPEAEKKDDLKPKPFSARTGPAAPQPGQPQAGAANPPEGSAPPPGEALPSEVVGSGPAGPGIRDEATTYDKLEESRSLLAQGKPAEAAEAARRAVELQPRNRQAYETLAESDRQLRNYKQALYDAEQGLKTFPNDADLLKNKIFALNKEGDFKAALETAEKALTLHSTDAVLLALKAYAMGRLGDREGMLKELVTAAALDPNFEPLLLQARAAAGGEPFLMPGDSREAPRQAPQPKRSRPSTQGLAIFGGLIVLLLLILGLLATSLFKKGSGEPPPEGQA